eukprot:3256104-Prymnesium_polylepis.1
MSFYRGRARGHAGSDAARQRAHAAYVIQYIRSSSLRNLCGEIENTGAGGPKSRLPLTGVGRKVPRVVLWRSRYDLYEVEAR